MTTVSTDTGIGGYNNCGTAKMEEHVQDQTGETTLIMVDDDINEIFLTRRQVRKDGIVNRFVSEKKPEKLLTTLGELRELGHESDRFLVLLDINMPCIHFNQ